MSINSLNYTEKHYAPLEFALGGRMIKNNKKTHKPTCIKYSKVLDKLISVAKILCPENDDNNLQLTGGASLAVQTRQRLRPIYDFDFTANDLDKIKKVVENLRKDKNSIIFNIDTSDERIVKGTISLGKTNKGKDGYFIPFSVTQRQKDLNLTNDNNDLLTMHARLDEFCENDPQLALNRNNDKSSESDDAKVILNEDDTSDYEALIREDGIESKDSTSFNSTDVLDNNSNIIHEDMKIIGTDNLTFINPIKVAHVKGGLVRRKNKFKNDFKDFKIAINLLKEQGNQSQTEFKALHLRYSLRNQLKGRLNGIRDPKLRKEAKNLLCSSQASVVALFNNS